MSGKNQRNDFSDLSEVDAVRLVANTAVIARDSGHKVFVKVATISGKAGILIWMPGYTFDGSDIVLLPPVANDDKPEEATNSAN